MAPGADLTALMTPSLPLLPWPPGCPGQATWVPISEEVQPAGSWAFMYEVNRNVLPEVSDRWTGTIGVPGRATPEFRCLIAGSFQVVIVALKVCASTVPFRFRCVDGLSPGTW